MEPNQPLGGYLDQGKSRTDLLVVPVSGAIQARVPPQTRPRGRWLGAFWSQRVTFTTMRYLTLSHDYI
jgi:hypothetical protein